MFFCQIYPLGLHADCWGVLPEAWISYISLESSQVRLTAPLVAEWGVEQVEEGQRSQMSPPQSVNMRFKPRVCRVCH